MKNKDYYRDNNWYDINEKKVVGIKRFLKHISIDRFTEFLQGREDYVPTDKYSELVSSMCRHGVYYILNELQRNDKKLMSEISIGVGIVCGNWHCWIVTYDYYIDLTAQQFDDELPELTIARRSNKRTKDIYTLIHTYTHREWIKQELSEYN